MTATMVEIRIPVQSSSSRRSRIVTLVALGCILALSLALRLHQFDKIPYPMETQDEFAFLWSGWSWLNEGKPTSWSLLNAYTSPHIYFVRGAEYRLVSPWFDHPPLYGLLTGLAATLAGATDILDAPLSAGRAVSVALGVVAVALLYLVARPRYGRIAALLAIAVYATVPTVVLASRLVVAESLIVTLALGTVFALDRYLGVSASQSNDQRDETGAGPGVGNRWWLVVAVVAVAAASLAKVPGLAVGLSGGLLLAANRRWREAVIVGLAGLAGLVPYVGYGLIADHDLFLAVLGSQGQRATGIEVLPRLLASSVVAATPWRDPWFPFLWIALAGVTAWRDRLFPAVIGPYLVFLVAATDQDLAYGWYREPLYPWLCLAGALFIRDAIARPNVIRVLLLEFLVAFGSLAAAAPAWSRPIASGGGTGLFPLGVALFTAPLFLWFARPSSASRTAVQLSAAVSVAIGLAASATIVWHAESLYPAYSPHYVKGALTNGSGLDLTDFSIEPDVIPPGGSFYITTSWSADQDISRTTLAPHIRSFSRPNQIYGESIEAGPSVNLSLRSGDLARVNLAGMIPESQLPGDYEVSIDVGGHPQVIGIIRCRAAAPKADGTIVGRPIGFERGLTIEKTIVSQSLDRPGEQIVSIRIVVEANQSTPSSVAEFVHLVTADGQIVAQSDLPIGGRTKGLLAGETVVDTHRLMVPASVRPGTYFLIAGLYDPVSGVRLGTERGSESVHLGLVEIGPPLRRDSVPHPISAQLSNGIELVGSNETLGVANGAIDLTLFWLTSQPIQSDYAVFVHVVDSAGIPVAQNDGSPDGGRLPTSVWRPGQIVVDRREISTAGLQPGEYRVLTGLYDVSSGSRVAVPGRQDGAVLVTTLRVP